MKALSIRQPWASMILRGRKTIETRTWPTRYRGDMLIVSSARPAGAESGQALCVVTLAECRPMTRTDEKAAACPIYAGAWAWVLTNVRPIRPCAVKGRLGLYEIELP